jgi:hypothetical protein
MASRDTMRNIALFRPSVTSGPGKKIDKGNDHSQSGVGYGSRRVLRKKVKTRGGAAKVTCPC